MDELTILRIHTEESPPQHAKQQTLQALTAAKLPSLIIVSPAAQCPALHQSPTSLSLQRQGDKDRGSAVQVERCLCHFAVDTQ